MWGTTLMIVTLAAALAALGYVASAVRKLDSRLGALAQEQCERRRCMERELERVRQSVLEMQ
jgi:hypothetical protein